MRHFFLFRGLNPLLCLLFFASWANAQVEVPYPLESFSQSTSSASEADVQQTLSKMGIEINGVKMLMGDAIIDSSVKAHEQIFEKLKPAGKWVSGYLYFKVSRTTEGGTTQSVRYYSELPKFPSGRRFTEALHFQLEPIYTAEDLHAIAPSLPEQFAVNFSHTPNVEESRIISLIYEIQSKDLPNMSSEFSTLPDELLELGGVSVEQDGLRVDAQWQCRLFAHSHDPKLEAYKQKLQPYLNKPRATSDTESQRLEEFFDQAGVDFKSHPKNNLIFDGEQMVLRLPPAEMAKARAIIAQYNEIRQSTLRIRYCHETASAKTRIEASKASLSGKFTSIHIPNLPLFGYDSSDADGDPPRIEFSSNTDLNIDDIAEVYVDTRAINLLNQSSIDSSQQMSLPSDLEVEVLSHQVENDQSSETWTLDISNHVHSWENFENDDEVTEFIPVSRRAVINLIRPKNVDPFAAPVDPFAAPIKQEQTTEAQLFKDSALKSLTGKEAKELEQLDLAYDGEQLIVTTSYENVQKLKELMLKFNYEAPAVGTLQLSYHDNSGEEVRQTTSLASDRGKRATFTIRRNAPDPTTYTLLSGTEMTFSPIIKEAGGQLSFSADMEWKTKPTNQNQHWWLTLDQNFGETFKAKQYLPPESEYSWNLEQIAVFKD